MANDLKTNLYWITVTVATILVTSIAVYAAYMLNMAYHVNNGAPAELADPAHNLNLRIMRSGIIGTVIIMPAVISIVISDMVAPRRNYAIIFLISILTAFVVTWVTVVMPGNDTGQSNAQFYLDALRVAASILVPAIVGTIFLRFILRI
jgi:hypothetical protein